MCDVSVEMGGRSKSSEVAKESRWTEKRMDRKENMEIEITGTVAGKRPE